MREKVVRRIEREVQIIYQVVKTSARQDISSNEMRSSIKNILKTLQRRYRLSDVKIVEQLHDQYHTLKTSFVKAKIEH
jgi:DNA-directed RNA polymerase specialized sigma54-like protein